MKSHANLHTGGEFLFLATTFGVEIEMLVVKKHLGVVLCVRTAQRSSLVWEKRWLFCLSAVFNMLSSSLKCAISVSERPSGRSHGVVATSHPCAQASTALHRTACCLGGLRIEGIGKIYSKLHSLISGQLQV